ncbi:MAG TPA: exopolysaccharide biosynthesis protein [Gammaproteobacteria bacterium]
MIRRQPDRTSELLFALAHEAGERVSFAEILHGLRHRAFGFTLLLFALPCTLPMPPGIPTVCGIALALVALNMLAGRQYLWLPRAITRRTVERSDLRRIVERVHPHLQRLERICRPRIAPLTEGLGKQLLGAVVFVLGVLLILPIPFLGNIPPAIATVVIAIGIAERDGVIVLIGLFCAAVAIALAGGAAWAVVRGIEGIF